MVCSAPTFLTLFGARALLLRLLYNSVAQEEEARRDAELEAQMVAALNGEAEDEDEKLIRERRRKRQEILAKHKFSGTSGPALIYIECLVFTQSRSSQTQEMVSELMRFSVQMFMAGPRARFLLGPGTYVYRY